MAVRQLRAAGIDIPILSCEGMEGTYWLDGVPDLKDFFVASYGASYNLDDSDAALNEYYKKHIEHFGKPQTSWGIEGYSIVEAWSRAVIKAGTTDNNAVVDELEKFEDEPLTIGPTTFTDKLHVSVNRPMSLLELRDGNYYFVAKMKADKVPELVK